MIPCVHTVYLNKFTPSIIFLFSLPASPLIQTMDGGFDYAVFIWLYIVLMLSPTVSLSPSSLTDIIPRHYASTFTPHYYYYYYYYVS
jgi:hypothetical protein